MGYILIFLIAGSLSVHAELFSPSAPTWFQVNNIVNASQDLGKHHNVSLSWRHGKVDSEHPTASEFVVYRLDLTSAQGPDAFAEIAVIPSGGDVMTFVDPQLRCGEYRYKVVGRSQGTMGEFSPAISVIVRGTTCAPGGVDARYLAFTTYPQTVVIRGKTFEYTAHANHSMPADQPHIRYQLMTAPDGMMIDSMTGFVQWTVPEDAQEADLVKIRAYHALKDGESGDQKWWFRLASQQELDVLDATHVEDEDDQPRDPAAKLFVSPNPASEQCQLRFKTSGGKATIELFSSDGSLVRTQTIETLHGQNIHTFNVSKISSGAYLLRVRINGVEQQIPLQITH